MSCATALLALLLLATSGGECLGAEKATTTATTPATNAVPQPRELNWQKLTDDVEFGEMEMPGAVKLVPVAKVLFQPGGGTIRLLDLEKPQITQSSWAIVGQVKYHVVGKGYIEMWSHFPDGTAYFSRTLDTSGPMGVLNGKSEWREFKLPFFSEPGKVPSKLEVNIVMTEGGGTIWLGPPTLKEVIAQPPPAAGAIKKAAGGTVAAPWWDRAQGGRIGGILGAALGIYGGIVGTVASRGRGRRLAVSLVAAMTVTCALLLAVGLIALGSGQPYAVWYPLTLTGGLGLGVSAIVLHAMKRRFEELEMRRMIALDV